MEGGRRDGRRRNELGDYGVLTPDAARRAVMQKLVSIIRGENPFEKAEEKAVTRTLIRPVRRKRIGKKEKT